MYMLPTCPTIIFGIGQALRLAMTQMARFGDETSLHLFATEIL